jgi:hypothetical protein
MSTDKFPLTPDSQPSSLQNTRKQKQPSQVTATNIRGLALRLSAGSFNPTHLDCKCLSFEGWHALRLLPPGGTLSRLGIELVTSCPSPALPGTKVPAFLVHVTKTPSEVFIRT